MLLGLVGLKGKLIIAGIAIIALLSLISGIYIKGRYDGAAIVEAQVIKEKMEWERKVSEAQVGHLQQVSQIHDSYNTVISKYKSEITKLTKNPKVVNQYVDRYVPVETQCNIPQGFVELHNKSASGSSLDDAPVNSSQATDKTLGGVGSVLAENYYRCNELAARLSALQQIVIEYQKQQKELIK